MKHNPSSSSPPRVVRPWRREQGTIGREGGGHFGTEWVPTAKISCGGIPSGELPKCVVVVNFLNAKHGGWYSANLDYGVLVLYSLQTNGG